VIKVGQKIREVDLTVDAVGGVDEVVLEDGVGLVAAEVGAEVDSVVVAGVLVPVEVDRVAVVDPVA